MSEQRWSQQVYEIWFEGHLSSSRAQMFEGLEMVQEPGGETILTGPVIDQAALHGILSRIRDLGVPLLSVKISLAPVLAYEQAIRVATDTYLADLTAEELERQVILGGNVLPVAYALHKKLRPL